MRLNKSISSIEFSDDMLFDRLSNIASSSPGPDGLHSVFIKNCAESLLHPLSYIFSLILMSGKFPDSWKSTIFIPIHKKNSKNQIPNYRPIAKVSHFAKVFDNMLEQHLSNFLSPILHPCQHGFVINRSTTSNLGTYISYITDSLNNGHQVDSIYTDFKSAFDSINHNILLNKLYCYGVQGTLLKLVSSFIIDRYFYVNVCGALSDPVTIPSGVPQGSHCGSLLFNIFINDLPLCINHAQVLLFADDMKLFMEIKSVTDFALLQSDIDNVTNWCLCSGMKLNLNKCCVISFSRRSSLLADYLCDGFVLNRVDNVKDLGVIFDVKLSFKLHISYVKSRAYSSLGILFRKTRLLKRPSSLVALYFCFVRSHLIYCSVIWTPYHVGDIKELESVQHKFLRLLSYKTNNPIERYSHDYSHISNKFRIPSIQSFHSYLDALFLFKVYNSLIDSPLLLSKLNIRVPPRFLRLTANFNVFAPNLMISNLAHLSVMNRCSQGFRMLSSFVDLNTISLYEFKVISKLSLLKFE